MKYYEATHANVGSDLLEIHNNEVRGVAPKGQLLEMTLDKGWDPMCEFLSKPVPDMPFPRANDTVAAAKYVQSEVNKLLFRWGATLVGGGIAAYLAWWIWGLVVE
jgi:hypothetical protein